MHDTCTLLYKDIIFFFFFSLLIADCAVSTTPSEVSNATYTLSCTTSCTQWKLYILDYPVPLAGACSTLPCLVDTASLSFTTMALKNQIGWKTSKPCSIRFNATTTGDLLMLAQSFNIGTHIGEVMIRSGELFNYMYYYFYDDSDPLLSLVSSPFQSGTI